MWRLLAIALALPLQLGCALIAGPTYDAFLYSESALSCLHGARRDGVREAKRKGHLEPNEEVARAESRCRMAVPRDHWRVSVLSNPAGAIRFTVDTWPNGLPVRARPRDAEWVEITFLDGRRGWVSLSHLMLIITFDQQAAA